MENDLNRRFSRVAKKFGGALRTVGSKLRGIIAGGAVAGIGAMMTNPIDSLNSTLDELCEDMMIFLQGQKPWVFLQVNFIKQLQLQKVQAFKKKISGQC